MPRVFITAAEHSGESHAAKLALALRERIPDIQLDGLGGPRMRDAGVHLLADTVANAAMGLKALLRAREVLDLLRQTRDRFTECRPDLLICVDSWTMNSQFARLARELKIPVLYFIAPQTWASREGRVARMRECIDRLACILPFEEAYFRNHGINTTYVGHPLFDDLPQDRTPAPGPRFPDCRPLIALPAGSRRGVARANFPRQLDVAKQIREAFPDAQFVVPTTEATDAIVRDCIDGLDWIEARLDAFDDLVRQADLAITVSGTAALHIAAWNVPMIVVYHGNWLLWHTIGRWIVKTRTYSLVNLLGNRETHIVPEFIPWNGATRPVAERAIEMLKHPEQLQSQRAQLATLIAEQDRPGASARAADIAVQMLAESR
jgi:lipid-A-disaccharide synthase